MRAREALLSYVTLTCVFASAGAESARASPVTSAREGTAKAPCSLEFFSLFGLREKLNEKGYQKNLA